MLTSLQRKTDRIKVLEEGMTDKPLRDMLCHNCKQRHYLVERKTDINNYFCTNCGALTPIRSMRRERGLAVPSIQQSGQTAIAQPTTTKDATGRSRDRKPKTLLRNHKSNPLEESLINKGFQIVDSQYNEPTAQ